MLMKISNLLKERASKVTPHITGTFSSAPSSFVENVYPVFVEKAHGSHMTDVDGNEYIDYLCALGPITLGYNYEPVDNAIINQLKKGIIFSLPHKIEVELSELFCKTIPHADMVKFEKSGSNAVTGAVRAARYISKRDKIAYCGSGGVWHDWYGAAISRNGGIPKFNENLIKIFDFNDSDGLEQIFEDNKNEIAAVVMEPTIFEKPKDGFFKKIRKLTTDNNSILILDEVVTGFRYSLGGAQEYFNIKGDFVCFGKGMANGLPMSAITGPSEYMKKFDELWVSSTNNRETLSMAGTIATINEMNEKNTQSQCWIIGKKFQDGWNKIAENYNLDIKLIGYPVRLALKCFNSKNEESLLLKGITLQEMVKRGIFMSPGPTFISYSHSIQDIELTLNKFDEVCKLITSHNENDYQTLLEGNLPKTIYSYNIKPTKKINVKI